jgi:hypothetical protein
LFLFFNTQYPNKYIFVMKRPRPFALISIYREITLPKGLGKAFPELREVAQEVRTTERALLVLTEDGNEY